MHEVHDLLLHIVPLMDGHVMVQMDEQALPVVLVEYIRRLVIVETYLQRILIRLVHVTLVVSLL